MTTATFTRVKSDIPKRDIVRWLPADDGEHRAAINHAYRILDGVLDGKGRPLSKEHKTAILRSIAAVPRLSDLGHGTRFENAQAWDAAVQRYADYCKELQQWGVTHEACIQWVHIRDFTHAKDPVEAWFTEVTERLAKGERPPPPVTFADMQAERIERSRKGYVNMTIKTEDAADIKEWTAKRQLCYKAAQELGRTAITESEPWLDQVFGKPWKETIRPMARADVEAKLAEAKAAEAKAKEPEPEAPKTEPEPEAPKVNGKELKEIWGNRLMKRHGRDQVSKVFLDVVGWAKWEDATDPGKGAMTDQEVAGLIQKHLDALEAATPDTPAKPAEPPITSSVEPPDGFPGEQPSMLTPKETKPVSGNNPFQPATKEDSYLRMALSGPAGSGKTYTALSIATTLVPGGKVAVIDTERGSSRKYAKLFKFDVLELTDFNPQKYIEAIEAASRFGYDVLIIDSLSHAWSGTGGVLDIVEKKKATARNEFAAWAAGTPLQNKLVDTLLATPVHIISTMRSKTEYVLEEVYDQQGRKKTVPRKVGLAPVQRNDIEYEFDVFGEISIEHNALTISKSRCPDLTDAVFQRAGKDVATILSGWLAA